VFQKVAIRFKYLRLVVIPPPLPSISKISYILETLMGGLDVILRHHSLLLRLLGAHKIEMVMVMEYLTLLIGVFITLTQDALKKQHSLWRQVTNVQFMI
jgi:hypothetical protein